MSASYCLVIADNIWAPKASAHRGITRVSEYQPEHSERQVSGSVPLGADSRWFGTLAVPMTGDQSALVTIEREGQTPAGAPDVPSIEMVIPTGEIEAVLALLRGLVAQARTDGVLPRQSAR